MPNYCSAFGCTNSSTKESCRRRGISFHKFPLADKTLLRRWLVNIRRAHFKPSPCSYMCSDHFTDEDFEYQPFTNRRGLKKGAIPTRFSFNFSKSGRGKRNGIIFHKNLDHEVYSDENASGSEFIGSDITSNKTPVDNPALLEILMNEKFYSPEQLEAVSLANDLSKSPESEQNNSPAEDERIVALKERLHAKILLRSLKKQFLEAEIKAVNAKKDYFEAKTTMLPQIQDSLDFEDSINSESNFSLHNIKARLDEEELAAQIEEKMLHEHLEKVRMQAAHYEKEYFEAKSSMLSFS